MAAGKGGLGNADKSEARNTDDTRWIAKLTRLLGE
jgi:hypothetical protein